MTDFDRLLKIIDKHFPDYTGIGMKTNFVKDFHADSLDILDFIMDIEETFNIMFEDTDNLHTVEDVLEYIKKTKD